MIGSVGTSAAELFGMAQMALSGEPASQSTGLAPAGQEDASRLLAAHDFPVVNPSVVSRFWTQPQTTLLPQVCFDAEGTGALQTRLTPEQAAGFLTHATSLSDEDRVHYGRFVVDRIEPRLGLLTPFVLSENVASLEEAVALFAVRFSDEEEMEETLRRSRLTSRDAWPGTVVPPPLRDLMSRVGDDAVSFLFDLRKLSDSPPAALSRWVARLDPARIPRATRYSLDRLASVRSRYPQLTDEAIRRLYGQALEQRILSQKLLLYLGLQDPEKSIPFLIDGAGLELPGLVAALAYEHAAGPGEVQAALYYRSAGMAKGLVESQGYGDFTLDTIRQSLTRQTDPRSAGRNMGNHFHYPEHGIYQTISALGLNIGFPLGGALHDRLYPVEGKPHVFYAEIGDATLSTNEVHEFLEGASVKDLPVILNVLDNGVGISVRPLEGRGTRDMASLARSKGFEFLTMDGNDVLAVYETHRQAAELARQGRRVLIWTQNLPRLNKHSSSSGRDFNMDELDPLPEFAAALVGQGLMRDEDILKRKETPGGSGFLQIYELGSVGEPLLATVNGAFEAAWKEPATTVESVKTLSRRPRHTPPVIEEPPASEEPTQVQMNVAVRAAQRWILSHHPSFLWGQDIAEPLGGVNQATAGLSHLFPGRVFNSPINEPLIVAMAAGFAMQRGAVAVVEIQFDDYSHNLVHRLEQLGLMAWLSDGRSDPTVIIRIATEPVPSGAIYHSMSGVNYFASIPGVTVVSPSNSRDAYGLMIAAAQRTGVTLFLEPKVRYRLASGPQLPGERRYSSAELKLMARGGWTPDFDALTLPIGKAARRRTLQNPSGRETLTIATWGNGTHAVMTAAETLAGQGIEAEVLDLRTLMPWDREAVFASVHETGALLVAHDGSIQAGLADHIVSRTMAAFQDEELSSGARIGWDLRFGVIGWDEGVPAMPQRPELNTALSLNPGRVVAAARRVVGADVSTGDYLVEGGTGGRYAVRRR